METFSTSRPAMLPQAINLLTLAVLVAATLWSGAQRPADQTAGAAQASTSTSTNPTQLSQPAHTATPADASRSWPTQASALPRDGLQAVGYQARTTR